MCMPSGACMISIIASTSSIIALEICNWSQEITTHARMHCSSTNNITALELPWIENCIGMVYIHSLFVFKI